MDLEQFEQRKRDHLRHALSPEHQAAGLSGLDRVQLQHDALPELDFAQVRLESVLLGASSATPFFIAGMTAGHEEASRLNHLLAAGCAARGWSMGVGSQRRDLDSSSIDRWVTLREEFPDLALFANLGASQLNRASTAKIAELVQALGARALVIHLNALQECMQPEGTPQFAGVLAKLRELVQALEVPVMVKETGCGISARTFRKLAGIGLAAIDVSGLGGTHWGRIEGARAEVTDPLRATAARTFAFWGESTVDSILAGRRELPEMELWASGGVRSGLDAAKLIALGASQVGYAKPALEAASQGAENLARWMEQQEFELRVAMFCMGMDSPAELRQRGQREGLWKLSSAN